jgi:quercetin dioxygenase-like cupin family protein
MNHQSITSPPTTPIPPDDLRRNLVLARPDTDQHLPHLGIVGGTYTTLLNGKDTAGRYCLVDMLILPGGGPPHHRHDFEETFTVLEGEIEATFRGKNSIVRAGETIHIPANAPHYFKNVTSQAARLLCICSPAGQEDLFAVVGVPVATRTTPPPKPDPAAAAAMKANAPALFAKYRTELVQP